MKKKWIFILSSLVLILSFQNCQKSELNNVRPEAANLSDVTSYNKTSASDTSIVQVWDYDQGRTLDVDVSNGRIAVYLNYGSDRAQDICLTDSEKQELQALLSSAEVCEPVLPADHFLNRQCTMNYRYPYAVLVQGSDQIKLGEMTSGCDVPTDLCGNKAQELQNFAQHLLASSDQRACQ